MKKSFFSPLFAAMALMSMGVVPQAPSTFRDETTGDEGAGSPPAKEDKSRKIAMDDGRELTFGEKTKIKKDYGTKDGNVFALIDFDNGKSIEVLFNAGNLAELTGEVEDVGQGPQPTAAAKQAMVTLALIGHGAIQKLGDAAAGAETTDDAFEAILEVAGRLNRGEFNKSRDGQGAGSAKGASELVEALCEYMGKSKEAVREVLQKVSAQEKAALRKVPDIAAIIDRIKAARAPSKKEAERLANAQKLADALKRGDELPTSAATDEVAAM